MPYGGCTLNVGDVMEMKSLGVGVSRSSHPYSEWRGEDGRGEDHLQVQFILRVMGEVRTMGNVRTIEDVDNIPKKSELNELISSDKILATCLLQQVKILPLIN
ncbi:hypothetical protein Acr_17g0007780 [Actinidia rufa]|uniref:Uncharacterized protein n=1 Tax=Actinidia rufa TaxID=165716 RepID=A0A7J0G340_9ERIC|nr:hypothetical protein Acr_17g0007780 [Actinidia rufa]